MTSPLPGDGAPLERPSRGRANPASRNSSKETDAWVVRGADEYITEKWNVVRAKLPAGFAPIYDRLATGDPEGGGLEYWQLHGQIENVDISGRLLEHCEVRFQTAIRRGRRTKNDNARHVTIQHGSGLLIAQGQARVL